MLSFKRRRKTSGGPTDVIQGIFLPGGSRADQVGGSHDAFRDPSSKVTKKMLKWSPDLSQHACISDLKQSPPTTPHKK